MDIAHRAWPAVPENLQDGKLRIGRSWDVLFSHGLRSPIGFVYDEFRTVNEGLRIFVLTAPVFSRSPFEDNRLRRFMERTNTSRSWMGWLPFFKKLIEWPSFCLRAWQVLVFWTGVLAGTR